MAKPDDISRLQADLQARSLEATGEAAAKALEGIERLAKLNLATAQASLEDTSEQIRALLAAGDVQSLTNLVGSLTRLAPEKFTAYASAVYAISNETGTGLVSLLEKQMQQSNQRLMASIEALASSAGPGADGALGFMRQAMTAASTTYEQVNAAARQYANLATPGAPAPAAPGNARKR